MAEAALGVAGSVVGVLSLAGQICNCIQKLYAFLDSVSHAECDVQSLRTELLLFETIIQSIREDYSNFSEFIDTKHLNASLKLCHSRIRRLAFSIIPRTASRKGSRGLKSSINLAFRRQSIANYVKDFDSAKLTLILAYQQYALRIIPSSHFGLQNEKERHILHDAPQSTSTRQPHASKPLHYSISQKIIGDPGDFDTDYIYNKEAVVRAPGPTTSIRSLHTYNSWLGKLGIRKYSTFWARPDRPIDTKSDAHSHTKRIIFDVQLVEWLCLYRIQLHAIYQMGHWSYTLYPLHKISEDSLLFEFCKEGDLKNVLRLFDKKLASPFDVSANGNTALHSYIDYLYEKYASWSGNPSLVRFLLHIGVDPRAENDKGISAFDYAMSCPHEEKHLELARLYIEHAQIDPMCAGSPWGILHSYQGSPDALQYLIHQDHFMISSQQRNKCGRTILQHQLFHRMYYGASFERVQMLLNTNHDLSSSIEGDPIYEGYTALHCAAHCWTAAKINEDNHTAVQCELFLRKVLMKANIHAISKSTHFTPLTVVGYALASRKLSSSSVSTIISEWLQMVNESGYDLSSYCQAEAVIEQKRPKQVLMFHSFDMVIRTGDKIRKSEISVLSWGQRIIISETPWNDQSKISKSIPIGGKDSVPAASTGQGLYVSKTHPITRCLKLYLNLAEFLVILLGAGILILFW